jgi:hypothetical protein
MNRLPQSMQRDESYDCQQIIKHVFPLQSSSIRQILNDFDDYSEESTRGYLQKNEIWPWVRDPCEQREIPEPEDMNKVVAQSAVHTCRTQWLQRPYEKSGAPRYDEPLLEPRLRIRGKRECAKHGYTGVLWRADSYLRRS